MSWPVSSERLARGLYWQEAWKLVEGCTHVSAGCDRCWSAKETKARAAHPDTKISIPKQGLVMGMNFNGKIRLREDNLDKPLRRKKPTVYAIWNDLFHEDVPVEFVDRMFCTMTRAPQHTFLILTKRPENFAIKLRGLRLPNLWLGVSVEDQQTADERIPILLQTPAAKRFVSYEPALGAVDFTPYLNSDYSCLGLDGQVTHGHGIEKLDWVIMGRETGFGARPMNFDWARKTRDDCKSAGVPFFFKGLLGGEKLRGLPDLNKPLDTQGK